jgi:tRNA A37 threonylcarbamoyladenosine modification protein TsaB
MFSENFIFIDTVLENINFFAVNNKKNCSLKIKNIKKSENLPILLKKFLSSNKIKINNTFNVYINLGPGNIIAIRNAITTAKTFSIIYNCNIFGVSFFDILKLQNNTNKILINFKKNIIGFDIKNKIARKILGPKVVNKSGKTFSNINIKVEDIKSVISLKKFTKKIVPIPLSSI